MSAFYGGTGAGATTYYVSNTSSTSITTASSYLSSPQIGIGNFIVNSDGFPTTLLAAGTYNLEDGTKLIIDDKGNFRIEDKDAKVTYKSNNVREFNKYINSSDLLSDFIEDMGKLGATAEQVLNTPIQFFIRWLIYKSAESDGEESDESLLDITKSVKMNIEPPKRITFKCKHCGKFIPNNNANNGIMFCNGNHADLFINKLKVLELT